MRIFQAALVILIISMAPYVSDALEENQGTRTLTVQNRQHTMTHEFGVWIGTLPMDAFTKGLTFTGAYTIHFDDLFAWEIGQFTYSYGVDTDLKPDLENLNVGPTPYQVVKYFATSNVFFKPIYGKMALLNRALIYGEVFINAGVGWGRMTLEDRVVVDVGAGGRVYLGKYVSFRVDLRDYMFVNLDDLHNELWIALGICLSFG